MAELSEIIEGLEPLGASGHSAYYLGPTGDLIKLDPETLEVETLWHEPLNPPDETREDVIAARASKGVWIASLRVGRVPVTPLLHIDETLA